MTCRHCKARNVNRPRMLCWACFYTPGVRDLYPITSKYGRRGTPNRSGVPCEPTAALPGTPEKAAVVERRPHAGQELWHPGDATHTEE